MISIFLEPLSTILKGYDAEISSVARSRILRLAARIAAFVRSAVESAGSLRPLNGAALKEAIAWVAGHRTRQHIACAGWIGRRHHLGNCYCSRAKGESKRSGSSKVRRELQSFNLLQTPYKCYRPRRLSPRAAKRRAIRWSREKIPGPRAITTRKQTAQTPCSGQA